MKNIISYAIKHKVKKKSNNSADSQDQICKHLNNTVHFYKGTQLFLKCIIFKKCPLNVRGMPFVTF